MFVSKVRQVQRKCQAVTFSKKNTVFLRSIFLPESYSLTFWLNLPYTTDSRSIDFLNLESSFSDRPGRKNNLVVGNLFIGILRLGIPVLEH